MSKQAIHSDDPLVMKVRRALRAIEPRKMPEQTKRNPYGFLCWICPYCEELIHQRGRDKMGGYNMHFSAMHGTDFWKEKMLIKLFRRELK